MRERGKLYFSPNYQFFELDFNNPEKLAKMFADRVYGFYINPAKLLSDKGNGFACGLLCIATIDALSRIMYSDKSVGDRIELWLKNNIAEFNQSNYTKRFYEDFRNGLVHEGRIKSFGEFSFTAAQMITTQEEVMRVNPRSLLERLTEIFQNYLKSLLTNKQEFTKFQKCLKRDFEFEYLKYR